MPDELFEEIAAQTNLYAAQKIEAGYTQRLAKWTETSKSEIKKFVYWMGLVKYWPYTITGLMILPICKRSQDRSCQGTDLNYY